MMRQVLSGLIRRARHGAWAVAFGLLPAPALALMPWSGEGACSAMLSPGLRVTDCDFRDYLDPGMPSPAHAATQAEPPFTAVEESCRAAEASDTVDSTPYDWAAMNACGPTDWDCSRSAAAPPVAEAVQAVLGLCPTSPLNVLSWESLDKALDLVRPAADALEQEREASRRSTRAALRVGVRTAAGRVSGTLDQIGRQFLGAAAAIDRVSEGDQPPVETTASRPIGPQPSTDPYGHLGL